MRLLLMLLLMPSIATSEPRCRLLINELSSLFLSTPFLETQENRGSSFVEFRFSEECGEQERKLTSRVFIVFSTKLFPSSPGIVPLFYTNFHQKTIDGKKKFFVIASKGQTGNVDAFLDDRGRTNGMNYLLSDTYNEAIRNKGIASFFGGSQNDSPGTPLRDNVIVFAVVKNDNQKRPSKRTANAWTSFLKRWSVTTTNTRDAMCEKPILPFILGNNKQEQEMMQQLRSSVEDLMIFVRSEKEAVGWETAVQFVEDSDGVFDAFVLPMISDSRTIPKGLSVNRVGDSWVYSKPTPGEPNYETDVAVNIETFDTSDLSPGDALPVSTRVHAATEIERRVWSFMRKEGDLVQSEGTDRDEELFMDVGLAEGDNAEGDQSGAVSVRREDGDAELFMDVGLAEGDNSEQIGEVDDDITVAADVVRELVDTVEDQHSTDSEEHHSTESSEDDVETLTEPERRLDVVKAAPTFKSDDLVFGAKRRAGNTGDEAKRPRIAGEDAERLGSSLSEDRFAEGAVANPAVRRGDMGVFDDVFLDEGLPIRPGGFGGESITKKDLVEAAQEGFTNCLPMVQAIVEANYAKMNRDLKIRVDRGDDLQKSAEDCIEEYAKVMFAAEKSKYSLSSPRDRNILLGLHYTDGEIKKFQELRWAKIVPRVDGSFGLRCMLEDSFESTKKNYFAHEYGATIPDRQAKHSAGKTTTKGGNPKKSPKSQFWTSVTTHWNLHAKHEDHRLQCIKSSLETRLARDQPLFLPRKTTEFLFLAVYGQIKMNLPLSNHPRFMSLLDDLGVDSGHKFRNDVSGALIGRYISDDLEGKLLAVLRSLTTGFSIITDAATDDSGTHYLIVFVRFTMHLRPVTVYLTALELLEGETGEYVWRLIKQFFTDKGLMDLLDNHLVALGTDGAPNMIGPKDGFSGRVRTHLESVHPLPGAKRAKKLVHVHCNAHRIELAFKKGMGGEHFTSNFDIFKQRSMTTKFSNTLKTYFGVISHTRRFAFRAVVPEDEPFIKLKGILDVRWTSSEGMALASLLRMYRGAWSALFNLASARATGANRASRALAAGLLHTVTDIRFYVFLLVDVQILSYIATYSQSAQFRTASYMQTTQFMQQMKTDFDLLKTTPWEAPIIKMHLQHMRCRLRSKTGKGSKGTVAACYEAIFHGKNYNDFEVYLEPLSEGGERLDFRRIDQNEIVKTDNGIKTTLDLAALQAEADAYLAELDGQEAARSPFDSADESAEVTRRGLKILKAFQSANYGFMTEDVISDLLDSVVASFEEVFEVDNQETIEYKMARWFSPQALLTESSTEGDDDRAEVYEYFDIDGEWADEGIEELRTLFENLPREDQDKLYALTAYPELFFPELANLVALPKQVEPLIGELLAIPASSAEVERAFSALFFMRDKRSSRLKVETIDQRLRIVLNGPSIEEWSMKSSVDAWIKNHHYSNDPSRGRGPDKKKRKEKKIPLLMRTHTTPDDLLTEMREIEKNSINVAKNIIFN